MSRLCLQLARVAVVGGALMGAVPSPARACSPLQSAALTALPRSGATEVSPASSIFVVAPPDWLPVGLTLEAAGMPVALPKVRALGAGMVLPLSPASFFQIGGEVLAPSTTYVLRATDPGGAAPVELTRFTTAAAYEKMAPVASRLTALRLWRVRYPASAINAGWCVFDEYHGYVDIDYEDGVVPGTPPDEVVGVVQLLSEVGSDLHTFTFTGGHFDGLSGELPHPAMARWQPKLMPDRVYCATITLHGRNNLAGLSAGSNTLCAPVTVLDMRGSNADGGADGPAGPNPTSDAGLPTGLPDALGLPTDAEQRPGGNETTAEKSRGCRFGSGGSPGAISLVLLMAALALVRRRRR